MKNSEKISCKVQPKSLPFPQKKNLKFSRTKRARSRMISDSLSINANLLFTRLKALYNLNFIFSLVIAAPHKSKLIWK